MKTVVDIPGRALIVGSGGWCADYIEAAHAKVPGRTCDESRLMKPAPCEGASRCLQCACFSTMVKAVEDRARVFDGRGC